MRWRASLVVGVVVSLALAAPSGAAAADRDCTSEPSYRPDVPSPQSVLGFPLGVGQQRPVTSDEIRTYLHAVDDASDRVELGTFATSVLGRPLEYAVVSSERNVGRLDGIARRVRLLREPRLLPKPAATAIARSTPAIAWMTGNIHGGEKSGADAALKVLYELAAREDCEVRERTRELVTVVVPTQNPDGRDAGDDGRRQNEYGFDLNRDWYARTQAETDGKIELLRRYPPQVFVDAHEMGGRQYFFPPNADPVHHEITDSSLEWVEEISRANAAAFGYNGACPPGDEDTPECYFNQRTYDLFVPEYGSTVPTTGFGAAGMTYEKGNDSPTENRVDQQFRTQWATVGWATDNRERLLREWSGEWRKAVEQGRRGELEPNHVVEAGHTVQFPVPDIRIRSYFLPGDRHSGDVRRIVERLRRMDVDVYRLLAPATVRNARVFGGRSATNLRLPAGSYWIPLAQPQKHWIQALLAEEPYAAYPAFYDVATWSNPLFAGIEAVSTGDAMLPLAVPVRGQEGGVRGDAPAGGSYGYALDSSQAAALTFRLLGQDVPLTRDADTNRVTLPAAAAPAGLPGLARELGVDVAASDRAPGGAPLRRPAIGLFAGTGQPENPVNTSSGSFGSTRYVIEQRWRASATRVSTADIESGAQAFRDLDVLIVADGRGETGGLTAAGLANLRAWTQAGGTYVGLRNLGTRLARSAELTSAAERPQPDDYEVIGSHFRVDASSDSPVALGRPDEDFVYNNEDPILEPSTTGVNVLTYPTGDRFWHNGHAQKEDALAGTAALIDEPVGDGHAVLFANDPTFRAWEESGEHLLANAVLAP